MPPAKKQKQIRQQSLNAPSGGADVLGRRIGPYNILPKTVAPPSVHTQPPVDAPPRPREFHWSMGENFISGLSVPWPYSVMVSLYPGEHTTQIWGTDAQRAKFDESQCHVQSASKAGYHLAKDEIPKSIPFLRRLAGLDEHITEPSEIKTDEDRKKWSEFSMRGGGSGDANFVHTQTGTDVEDNPSERPFVFLTGAGISLDAGIPDFASGNSIFNTFQGRFTEQQRRYFQKPQDLFDARKVYPTSQLTTRRLNFAPQEVFAEVVAHFVKAAREAKKTSYHDFLMILAGFDMLRRVYSQNIDNIEARLLNHKESGKDQWCSQETSGDPDEYDYVPPEKRQICVQLHGSLAESFCPSPAITHYDDLHHPGILVCTGTALRSDIKGAREIVRTAERMVTVFVNPDM
ncbi:hypothetical protein HDU93_005435 [Gonapodya sp. JEL0774]|nr:hypothetical protein HDU93_005435 [Gonapodya sp. JEL0774]